jgi:hypothetical protein
LDSKETLSPKSNLEADLFFAKKNPNQQSASDVNYIITEIADEASYAGAPNFSGSNLNRPLVNSTSPSPDSTIQNVRPPMKKLFNDWNNLLDETATTGDSSQRNSKLSMSETANLQTASSSISFTLNKTGNRTNLVNQEPKPRSQQQKQQQPTAVRNTPTNNVNGRFEVGVI